MYDAGIDAELYMRFFPRVDHILSHIAIQSRGLWNDSTCSWNSWTRIYDNPANPSSHGKNVALHTKNYSRSTLMHTTNGLEKI